MSVASANFFALLDDADAAANVQLEREPSVKTTTSSKKTDRDPRADPSKARPKKADPNGNNAAFRDKNAGRSANRRVEVTEHATAHFHRSSRAERSDRKERPGSKKDTPKRVQAGWGDNRKEADDEVVGEAIAQNDRAEASAEDSESVDAEPAIPTLTLEEYLKQQNESSSLNRAGSRQPNEGADNAQWADAKDLVRDDVEVPTSRKFAKAKPRAHKEVETLELDDSLAPPLNANDRPPRRDTRDSRPPRGDRPPRRESNRPPRSSGKPGAKSASKPTGSSSGKPSDKSGKPAQRPAKATAPKIDLTALPKLG